MAFSLKSTVFLNPGHIETLYRGGSKPRAPTGIGTLECKAVTLANMSQRSPFCKSC